MPEYKFKCSCKKTFTTILPFSEILNAKADTVVTKCPVKTCGRNVRWGDVQVEFKGAINMNSSSVGVAQRKYSNKAGGPKPVIDGKIRNDLKMPTQV